MPNGDGVAEKSITTGFGRRRHRRSDDAPSGFGARSIGIENLATAGVQGRGVLVDLERLHGRKRALIDYDGLMEALRAQNAEVEVGDFLCLYTGFADVVLEMRKKPDGAVLASVCSVLDGRDRACCSGSPIRASSQSAPTTLPLKRIRQRHRIVSCSAAACHCLFKLGLHLGNSGTSPNSLAARVDAAASCSPRLRCLPAPSAPRQRRLRQSDTIRRYDTRIGPQLR
jgi:hypothetical protein